MIQVAWYTLLVLLTLAALVLLWQFRIAVILFGSSLAVAAAFRPIINYWVARKIPRTIALLFSYLLVLLVILGFFLILGDALIADVSQAVDDFLVTYERIRVEWPQQGNYVQQLLAEQLLPYEDLNEWFDSEEFAVVTQTLLGVASQSVSLLNGLAITLVLSMYWGAERVHFERVWLSLLPVEKRARARDVWHDVEVGVGSYLREQVVMVFLVGILLGVGYALIGVRYPGLLVVAGMLARLIPWLGPILAVIPPLLVGLGQSAAVGMWAFAYTLIVFFVLETVVEARLLPEKHYSSLLVILLLITLVEAVGVVGIVLAPPLAVAVQILLGRLIVKSPERVTQEETELMAAEVREQFARLETLVEETDEAPAPEVVSLISRAKRLATRTERFVFEGGDTEICPLSDEDPGED